MEPNQDGIGQNHKNTNILRSCRSNQIAYVKFYNKSLKDISLEWIDFRGHHKVYAHSLQPNSSYSVKTFVGHPWVAYSTKFRYPMTFQPDDSFVHFPVGSEMTSGVPTQTVVYILSPMCSLEKLCLQVLHKHICDENHIDLLEIHPKFKEKLKKLFFNQKNVDLRIRIIEI